MLLLGAIVYWITQAALERQFNLRMELEAATVAAQFRGDLAHFKEVLAERQRSERWGRFNYLLVASNGMPIEGTLRLNPPAEPGWSERILNDEARGEQQELRIFTIKLGDGLRLSVARDLSPIRDVEEAIMEAFGWGFAATLLLGLAGGLFVSSRFLGRVDSMTSAAQAIIDGNMNRRLPVLRTNDDLDFLALTLNRMLDRINELMESIRQVSSDIAHDLRTPLSRLRHRLEAAFSTPHSPAELREAISSAIVDTDDILATFSALLRIAQIEAGTRRAAFATVDLSSLAADVAEAFAPSIQDEGMVLKTSIKEALHIVGDKELLTQLLANILENAIRHTPAGTRIELQLDARGGQVVLLVADNGPGVPAEARSRLFDRFYRLEGSRTTPGSGLGLSLAKAIADLHEAKIELTDNHPGLKVECTFQKR